MSGPATSEICGLLERALAAGAPRRCRRATRHADPPAGATVSPVPRLLLAISGRGAMRAGFARGPREVPFADGDCCVIGTQVWNQPVPGPMGFVVLFDYGDHLRANRWYQPGPGQPRIRSRNTSADGMPDALRQAWGALRSLAADADDEVARALALAVLRLAHDHLLAAPQDPHPGRSLQRALVAWIDEELHRTIDRRDAARAFGVHPNHVTRVFREHGSAGFAATLIARRLDRAAALLGGSELPVAEVGARCGYPDPAAFSTAFRKRFGLSPRRYRG